MAYRKVYLEWTIGADGVLNNVPVGFEVEFSRDSHFHEITTTLTTFDEVDPTGAYRFWYSVDEEGTTWVQYPWGDQGMIFTAPFKMRLEINPSDLGYSLSFFNGLLKKVSADSKEVIASATLTFDDISEIKDVDQYEDILYLVGTETLYKIDGRTLEPYDNSLPLLYDDAIGVSADESRGTFWQVNQTSVCLRSLYGDILWCSTIPTIDIEVSSSSSSSTSSSSSSSSSSSEYMFNALWEDDENAIWEDDENAIWEDDVYPNSSSSESVGNESSSSSSTSSSSSSSESSIDAPVMYGTGFDAFTDFRGTYHAFMIVSGYYVYRNENGCILQRDPYGITTWKLYLDETHRTLARDHYYKNSDSTEPYEGGSDNYGIHMWWDVNSIPPTGLTGTISDTP